jgi:hypothetical protein
MTVNWSAIDQNLITSPGGTVGAPVGGLIEIGKFSVSDATLLANQDSPLTLQADFSAFATGLMGQGSEDGTHLSGYPGVFTEASIAVGTAFLNAPIYLMVFNTSSAATATQVGIFKGGDWVFPALETGTATLDTDTIGTTPVVGAYSTGTFASSEWTAGANALQMHQVIPEPSTITLVGLGLIGAVGLARRRRS